MFGIHRKELSLKMVRQRVNGRPGSTIPVILRRKPTLKPFCTMKTKLMTLLLAFLSGSLVTAQPIPNDSLYLGQTPPGNTPQVFDLWVNPGSFAAERIAISADSKEIYYSEVHGYYPTSGDTIRYYKYSGNHWTGPFNLFQNYLAPALSPGSDTLYFQNNSSVYESFYAVRNGASWGTPHQLLTGLNSAHYLQKTDSGNLFISSIPAQGTGGSDWCRLSADGADTVAVSLGLPMNTAGSNLDFFVARDESFMILARNGLKISYHKPDGSWTNPKDLGAQINFGLGAWGPFVSSDHKYLFYTTGTNPNYSDTYIYWVRVDSLIDSLMFTNYLPYVKNRIPDQEAIKGDWFTYTVPDSTFIDDDGNNTLSHAATLASGNPLPGWLTFDTATQTFSGTPEILETLNIKVTATDTAGAFVSTNFKIRVNPPVSVEGMKGKGTGFRVYPNPSHGLIHLALDSPAGETATAEITNLAGEVILSVTFVNRTIIDLQGHPGGLYILKLRTADETLIRKIRIN
jgi:hypothetical protein